MQNNGFLCFHSFSFPGNNRSCPAMEFPCDRSKENGLVLPDPGFIPCRQVQYSKFWPGFQPANL
jgi:hypothetical protein